MLTHTEKVQERWWSKLLSSEEEIDISKIDCSRPLNELPEDHIAKVYSIFFIIYVIRNQITRACLTITR